MSEQTPSHLPEVVIRFFINRARDDLKSMAETRSSIPEQAIVDDTVLTTRQNRWIFAARAAFTQEEWRKLPPYLRIGLIDWITLYEPATANGIPVLAGYPVTERTTSPLTTPMDLGRRTNQTDRLYLWLAAIEQLITKGNNGIISTIGLHAAMGAPSITVVEARDNTETLKIFYPITPDMPDWLLKAIATLQARLNSTHPQAICVLNSDGLVIDDLSNAKEIVISVPLDNMHNNSTIHGPDPENRQRRVPPLSFATLVPSGDTDPSEPNQDITPASWLQIGATGTPEERTAIANDPTLRKTIYRTLYLDGLPVYSQTQPNEVVNTNLSQWLRAMVNHQRENEQYLRTLDIINHLQINETLTRLYEHDIKYVRETLDPSVLTTIASLNALLHPNILELQTLLQLQRDSQNADQISRQIQQVQAGIVQQAGALSMIINASLPDKASITSILKKNKFLRERLDGLLAFLTNQDVSRIQPTDLPLFLHQLIGQYKEVLANNILNPSVQTDLTLDLGTLDSLSTLIPSAILDTIILNLIRNAQSAVLSETNEHGSGECAQTTISIRPVVITQNQLSFTQLTIENNGPQISEDRLGQLNAGTNSVSTSGGSGAGLGLIRHLANLYGKVVIENGLMPFRIENTLTGVAVHLIFPNDRYPQSPRPTIA